MEGNNVFHFQIQERRNRSWRCFTMHRAQLLLMVALLCLFFLWWLVFNSVRLEIKDGRTTEARRKELLHLMDFYSDFAVAERPPSAAEPAMTKEEEDEAEALFNEMNLPRLNSLNETQLRFVSFSTTAIPPPPPPPDEQMSRVISALKGAKDFVRWAGLLSSANTSSLPLSATLFIPGNDAISHLPTASINGGGLMLFDPLLIPYHILPQCLPFSQLQQFKLHSRLPTLLPSKYIVITNNSLNNFTINDALITHPDIFLTSTFAVHGINKILQYSAYGNQGNETAPLVTTTPPTNNSTNNTKLPRRLPPPLLPGLEVIANNTSGSGCLCILSPVVLSVLLFWISCTFARTFGWILHCFAIRYGWW